MPKRVHVWDTRTGKKLPNTVPVSHLKLMPHLSQTPRSKARHGLAIEPPDNPQPEQSATEAVNEEDTPWHG